MWYLEISKMPQREVNVTFWDEPYFYLKALYSNETDPICLSVKGCQEYACSAFDIAVEKADNKEWGRIHKIVILKKNFIISFLFNHTLIIEHTKPNI